MNAIKNAVSELFDAMGLDRQALPQGAHVAINIDTVGQLHMEEHDEELVVYLAKPVDVSEDKIALQKKALAAVHFETLRPFPVQAAMHDPSLIFLTRIAANHIDVPTLERAVGLLADLQQEIRA